MFDILHTDPDFIVINKYPNVSVHKDDGDTMLLKQVAEQVGQSQLYLIHRLDKMTSGILLLGRNAQAARELSSQFAERKVEKFYLAISDKKPKKKQGLICGDMQRSRRSAWKLVNSKHNPAITQFFSTATMPGERLFICKPHTGKTHQIRVALKSLGSAIVGDPIYANANTNATADANTKRDSLTCDNSNRSEQQRGYLHAFALGFTFKNQAYRFVCDPRNQAVLGEKWNQEKTSQSIEDWKAPWELSWPKINP